MLINKIALNVSGYVTIEIEGFYIQRFINLCVSKGIFLDNTKHINKSKIITKINQDDFKEVCKIAKKIQCRIKILKKGGIPFCIHKYRKRKIFLVFLLLIGIVIFGTTRFVWNIEVNGLQDIEYSEIEELLEKNGVKIGVLISNIEMESLINKIRLEREDIAWVGAKVKGTNFILNIVEAEKKPIIVDENKKNNIISDKKGIITKINVQSGTARVNVGDEVEEGKILVEGIMEGKYTGVRYVNSRADIFAKITYSKSDTKNIIENEKILTGNEQNVYKIKLNKFKINLNKGVSNFEKYDTIYSNKKLRFFSNYYLPIELEKVTYKEIKNEEKTYSVEEITNELKTKLENEILNNLENKYEKFIESTSNVEVNENNVTVIVNCVVEEKIGINQDLVF